MSRQRKTLTYKDIKEIYELGAEILFMKGSHPKKHYGNYDPNTKKIRIYLPIHKSRRDISDTILHEHVHAIEGERGFKTSIKDNEIETIIERTLKIRPGIVTLIRKLYRIKY